jgi:sigma-E factor negative regulatory protein RseC
MLQETAKIVRIEDTAVWVETQRKSACGNCVAKNGCGVSVLDKLFGNKRSILRVLAEPGYKLGDEVVIGIREQALVRGSLAVYCVPLLGLMLGSLVGTLAANKGLTANSELSAIVMGVAGFVAGLLWLRHFTRQIQSDRRYQPVVLHRISDTGSHPVVQ